MGAVLILHHPNCWIRNTGWCSVKHLCRVQIQQRSHNYQQSYNFIQVRNTKCVWLSLLTIIPSRFPFIISCLLKLLSREGQAGSSINLPAITGRLGSWEGAICFLFFFIFKLKNDGFLLAFWNTLIFQHKANIASNQATTSLLPWCSPASLSNAQHQPSAPQPLAQASPSLLELKSEHPLNTRHRTSRSSTQHQPPLSAENLAFHHPEVRGAVLRPQHQKPGFRSQLCGVSLPPLLPSPHSERSICPSLNMKHCRTPTKINPQLHAREEAKLQGCLPRSPELKNTLRDWSVPRSASASDTSPD